MVWPTDGMVLLSSLPNLLFILIILIIIIFFFFFFFFCFLSQTCSPVDACKTSPCGLGSTGCIDLPPPAGDGPDGRVCQCGQGYAPDPATNGSTCENVDACKTKPVGKTGVKEEKRRFKDEEEKKRKIRAKPHQKNFRLQCHKDAECLDLDPPFGDSYSGRVCQCKVG